MRLIDLSDILSQPEDNKNKIAKWGLVKPLGMIMSINRQLYFNEEYIERNMIIFTELIGAKLKSIILERQCT